MKHRIILVLQVSDQYNTGNPAALNNTYHLELSPAETISFIALIQKAIEYAQAHEQKA